MPTRWLRNKGVFGGSYDFTRLIDYRPFDRKDGSEAAPSQIICDIDKTYLETNFESVLQMVRIAFEDASQKITVRGASEVLLAARWGLHNQKKQGFPRPLHFISASPPQMRSVLEEKLALDGLDWNTDTFKNQAYNLRKGRMSALRHHTAYKTASILRVIKDAAAGTQFFLIGDNAEYDAFVYTGIALFLEGRLSAKGYQKYLQLGGVENEVTQDFVKFVQWKPDSKRIAGILIRKAPGYGVVTSPPLTDPIFIFDNYFEAALKMMQSGLIEFDNLWPLTRAFHNQHGLKRRDIAITLDQFKAATHDQSVRLDIDRIQKRLWEEQETATHIADNPFYTRILDNYRRLDENEILQCAAAWCASIQRHSHNDE